MEHMSNAQLIKLMDVIDAEINKLGGLIKTKYWLRLKNTKLQAQLELSKRV